MGSLYRPHRFPPEIISHAVWLYHRFTLSFRDVEDDDVSVLSKKPRNQTSQERFWGEGSRGSLRVPL